VCRAIAIAALFGILATFVTIQPFGNLMSNAIDLSGDASSSFLLFSLLFAFLATTTFALSFASGVVGMVMAGQRRQRLWLSILLATVVIETYASLAIIMIPAIAQLVFAVGPVQGLAGSASDPLLRLQTVNDVIAPQFAPLAALIYSLRAQRGVRSLAGVRTPDKEAGPAGLEYSRLDDASAG
jgi:hypothetical protein